MRSHTRGSYPKVWVGAIAKVPRLVEFRVKAVNLLTHGDRRSPTPGSVSCENHELVHSWKSPERKPRKIDSRPAARSILKTLSKTVSWDHVLVNPVGDPTRRSRFQKHCVLSACLRLESRSSPKHSFFIEESRSRPHSYV